MIEQLSSEQRAKALLTERFGISTAEADNLLHHCARNCHRTTRAVADVLLHQVWNGDTRACDRPVARTLENALRNLPDSARP